MPHNCSTIRIRHNLSVEAQQLQPHLITSGPHSNQYILLFGRVSYYNRGKQTNWWLLLTIPGQIRSSTRGNNNKQTTISLSSKSKISVYLLSDNDNLPKLNYSWLGSNYNIITGVLETNIGPTCNCPYINSSRGKSLLLSYRSCLYALEKNKKNNSYGDDNDKIYVQSYVNVYYAVYYYGTNIIILTTQRWWTITIYYQWKAQ